MNAFGDQSLASRILKENCSLSNIMRHGKKKVPDAEMLQEEEYDDQLYAPEDDEDQEDQCEKNKGVKPSHDSQINEQNESAIFKARNMRQRQVQLAGTTNNIGFELDDEQEGVEVTSEHDLSDNETESSRRVGVLMEAEGTTMDKVNVEEPAGNYQDPSTMEVENNIEELADSGAEVKKHRKVYD
ncbi:hypothetical protein V2J09_011110 [Rumex salicifolius]